MNEFERIQRFPFQQRPDPAAGANFTIRPAGNGWWRIISLAFTFTTSAAVANRAVSVEATNGAETFFRAVAGSVQPASLAWRYGGAESNGAQITVGLVATIPWPDGGVALSEGWSLKSVVDNIDVGDQFTNVTALVEELPTGRYLYVTPVEPYSVESWGNA